MDFVSQVYKDVEVINSIDKHYKYKGYEFKVIFEMAYCWSVVCNGKAICTQIAPARAVDMFKKLVDSGMEI